MSAIAVAADNAPQAEVFGGYSYLHCDWGYDIPCNLNGWDASIAINANKYFGIVADFGGVYGKANDTDIKAHTFLFGPKFAVRQGKITPFAQALFGVSHEKYSYDDSSFNFFAMSLGGGLDLNAGKNIAVRLAQVEYNQTQSDGFSYNQFRFSTGIVFKLGNR